MSEIEIPDEAELIGKLLAAAVDTEAVDAFPVHGAQITSNRAAHMLRSVYPSIRCQVLESVVEDVAKVMFEWSGGRWDVLSEEGRELVCEKARRVLGLTSEGEEG